MLALATTRVRLEGRDPAAEVQHDAHGAPLPAAQVERGPYAAHRRVGSQQVSDAGDAQLRTGTWYLEPAAWPVLVGDTIVDVDGSRWSVDTAELLPSGLGLEQVVCDSSRADVQVR